MSVRIRSVWLDYGTAANDSDLLKNLSAIGAAGSLLWTASDEGRTIECLRPHSGGYRIHRQIKLDAVFRTLPGRQTQDEADIESIDVVDGRLWLCGSHCRVRRQVKKTGSNRVDPKLRVRKSRRLLGSVALTPGFDDVAAKGEALPFAGKGSLHRLLADDVYIDPFIKLPSKENGLDIEGLAVIGNKVLLGLRGPLVDSIAMVVELSVTPGMKIKQRATRIHFLNLHGLGVRDLARWNDKIIILAGPVSSASGPFRLYRWAMRKTDSIQHPRFAHEWPVGSEAPEGLCRQGQGLLVLYDVGDKPERIDGSRFRADWLTGV